MPETPPSPSFRYDETVAALAEIRTCLRIMATPEFGLSDNLRQECFALLDSVGGISKEHLGPGCKWAQAPLRQLTGVVLLTLRILPTSALTLKTRPQLDAFRRLGAEELVRRSGEDEEAVAPTVEDIPVSVDEAAGASESKNELLQPYQRVTLSLFVASAIPFVIAFTETSKKASASSEGGCVLL